MAQPAVESHVVYRERTELTGEHSDASEQRLRMTKQPDIRALSRNTDATPEAATTEVIASETDRNIYKTLTALDDNRMSQLLDPYTAKHAVRADA